MEHCQYNQTVSSAHTANDACFVSNMKSTVSIYSNKVGSAHTANSICFVSNMW